MIPVSSGGRIADHPQGDTGRTNNIIVCFMPLFAGPVGIVTGYVVGVIIRMISVMLVFICTGGVNSLVPAVDTWRVRLRFFA